MKPYKKPILQYNEIIDISYLLAAETPVYPGNPTVKIEEFSSQTTHSVNSIISMGTHVGTHIDGPAHAIPHGASFSTIPLERFVGNARVLDMRHVQNAISVDDLLEKNVQRGERILLRTTNSDRDPSRFFPDYIYISAEAAAYLAECSVSLVGIDAFSVKQKGSSDNRPHTTLLTHSIPIIEGIRLSGVEEGEYVLVILPLKTAARDAAPARAVLLR